MLTQTNLDHLDLQLIGIEMLLQNERWTMNERGTLLRFERLLQDRINHIISSDPTIVR